MSYQRLRHLASLILCATALSAAPKVLEKFDIEPVWSGHSVSFDLLVDGDHQFAAYYDAERRMTVASRRKGDVAWTIKKLDTVLGWDSHNYVDIGLDRDGHLHVSGNMHNVPLIYFRSSKPRDAGSLERVAAMTGVDEKKVTYPLFYRTAEGALVFMYRDGSSGNGRSLLNIYDEKTRSWKRHLEAPLFDGLAQNMSAYPSTLRQDAAGWFHIAWMWRDTPDCASNHTLCHAKTPDLKNWFNAAGKPIKLPILPTNSDVMVDPTGPGKGMINVSHSVGFDAQDRPILNYHKHDENGNSQIYLARFEEGSWKRRPVTNWKTNWSPSGGGTIVVEVTSSPVAVLPDGRLAMSWANAKEGSEKVILDPATLAKVGPHLVPPVVPKELSRPVSAFPGMGVRWKTAVGDDEDAEGPWMLRWESRGAFRDRQPEGEIPAPTMLSLYRFAE